MLGNLYNIVVAVVAVSLVLGIVGGALFTVVHGLLTFFFDFDIWTPVAETLAPLFEDLEALAKTIWAWLGDLWGQGMDALNGEDPAPVETPEEDGGDS